MADDDDYVYDEATGEWRPASEVAAAAAAALNVEVRDASGKLRGKRHMDLENAIFIPGGDLVGFYSLGQSQRSLELSVESLAIFRPRLFGFSLPRNGQKISFGLNGNVFRVDSWKIKTYNVLVVLPARLHPRHPAARG